MNEPEHVIDVKSVQVWRGKFNEQFLNEDGELKDTANDLQFEDEKSLSLNCSCGKTFYKFKTAELHLKEVVDK